MCALSLRADIDGRDSLDGYRNRSRYYRGIAHEVLIRAVAATVSALGPFPDIAAQNHEVRFTPESGRRQLDRSCPLSARSGPSLADEAGWLDLDQPRRGNAAGCIAVAQFAGHLFVGSNYPFRRALLHPNGFTDGNGRYCSHFGRQPVACSTWPRHDDWPRSRTGRPARSKLD